ncbi:hypothetical protein GGX14DRAFT_632464 [Mycena pura]|uniref:Uncharacterized protein n=1 Tax=Mycena pura TaxID=153505 RepID=A0AAD6VCP7_9AGAR|nr:hypothetical protein GGX14DRAFT_632464 [Mycena pura]
MVYRYAGYQWETAESGTAAEAERTTIAEEIKEDDEHDEDVDWGREEMQGSEECKAGGNKGGCDGQDGGVHEERKTEMTLRYKYINLEKYKRLETDKRVSDALPALRGEEEDEHGEEGSDEGRKLGRSEGREAAAIRADAMGMVEECAHEHEEHGRTGQLRRGLKAGLARLGPPVGGGGRDCAGNGGVKRRRRGEEEAEELELEVDTAGASWVLWSGGRRAKGPVAARGASACEQTRGAPAVDAEGGGGGTGLIAPDFEPDSQAITFSSSVFACLLLLAIRPPRLSAATAWYSVPISTFLGTLYRNTFQLRLPTYGCWLRGFIFQSHYPMCTRCYLI